MRSTILLRFTTIHHLLGIVLWIHKLILKLIPKWRAILVLILECSDTVRPMFSTNIDESRVVSKLVSYVFFFGSRKKNQYSLKKNTI
jgi:hypothetical protein